MAKSRGLGLAALVPNRVNFTKAWQSKVAPQVGAALTQLGKALGKTISVNSGYRSPSYNKSVGGAKASYHTKGLAADIDMTGWTEAEKQAAVAQLASMGVGAFITYTNSPNMLHIDMRPAPGGPVFMHDKTARKFDQAPQWMKDVAAQVSNNAIVTPDVMDAPKSYAQTMAANLPSVRPTTLTPDRALNAYAPPSRFPGVAVGKVTRAPLDAIPASLTPAPVGRVERAPLPDIGQFTTPARSLQHPVSAPKPSPLAAAPVGQVTRAPLSPATDINPQTLAEQYGMYRPSTVTQMPTVATPPPSVPVGALPAAQPAPLAPPAATVAPAPVLAPALTPPKTVRDYPVADIAAPPAPPAATAYDVYSGMATEAKDNTGKNTIGMLPDGTSTVTNQYGVTTGMTPYGKQTAVGNLPGITGPVGRTVGKMAMPAVGGLLGGPLGGMLGALASYGLSRPGGILSGIRNIDTIDGTIQAYRPDSSLRSFPSAPSHGIRDATYSNRSRSEMDSISPRASADISAGRGGLF